MSDYAKRLQVFQDKRQKLTIDYNNLIEKRKKEIGELAEQCNLLTIDDVTLLSHFSLLTRKINEHSPPNSNTPSADQLS